MEHGSEAVKTRRLNINEHKATLQWMWVAINPNNPVVFVNTDNLTWKLGIEDLKRMKNKNFIESAIVNMCVSELINSGVDINEIGIITPFLDQ